MTNKKLNPGKNQENGKKVLIISSCAQLHKGGQPFTVINMALHMALSGFNISFITTIPENHRLFAEMKKAGISIYSIPIRDSLFFPIVFGLFSLFVGFFVSIRNNVKVIQVHAPSSAIIGFMLKVLAKKKVSLVFHGFWRYEKVRDFSGRIQKFTSSILMAIERMLYRGIDVFIVLVNADIYAEYLKDLGVEDTKIAPTCCGPPTFSFASSSHDPKEYEELLSKFKKRIFFIGKFDGMKGQDMLIRVIPDVLRNHPETGFIFAGDGPERKKCEGIARSLKIEKNTVFLGSRDDVPNLLGLSDVAVSHLSPSLEGIGTAQREIVQHKVPLVTKNDKITRDYFGDSVAYVDPGNPNELSDRISAILSDEESARRMAEKAFEILEEEFSWDRCTRDLKAIYGEI